MLRRLQYAFVLIVVTAGVGAACQAGPRGETPAAAPASAGSGTILRLPDGKPNLSGIWQTIGSAHWDLENHIARSGPVLELGAIAAVPAGMSVVDGDAIPYQEWAAAKKKENYENWLTRDPEVKCYLPGIPRATYMPFPFQILQSHNSDILMAYEYASASRVVKMGPTEPPPVDTWMGQSTGKWDGDTLVVDTIGFNGQTWLDRAGNFHSESLHVVERFTPKTPDLMEYEATLEDPKVFTRPWKIQLPLYRRQDKNVQLLEFKCVEFVEEVMYGHLRKKTGNEKPFAAARMRWP